MIRINSVKTITTFDKWVEWIDFDLVGSQDIDQFLIDSILFEAKKDLTKLGLKQLTQYLENLETEK